MKTRKMGVVCLILVMAIMAVVVGYTNIIPKIEREKELKERKIEYLIETGFTRDENNPYIWRTVEGTHWDRYEVDAVYNMKTNRAIITERDPVTGEVETSVCECMGNWFLVID